VSHTIVSERGALLDSQWSIMLRDLQGLALGPIVDVVRLLRDSLEDSTASNPSLTCFRNDGQGHGLSTLCNINAILWSSRIAMATEFLTGLAPGASFPARKNLGHRPSAAHLHTVSTVTFTCCLTHSVRCDHELRSDWCYLYSLLAG
jgi:hypothetical protein